MFTAGKPYDVVLLTSGVLGGGTRSYDFRLDLREPVYLIHAYQAPLSPRLRAFQAFITDRIARKGWAV